MIYAAENYMRISEDRTTDKIERCFSDLIVGKIWDNEAMLPHLFSSKELKGKQIT